MCLPCKLVDSNSCDPGHSFLTAVVFVLCQFPVCQGQVRAGSQLINGMPVPFLSNPGPEFLFPTGFEKCGKVYGYDNKLLFS